MNHIPDSVPAIDEVLKLARSEEIHGIYELLDRYFVAADQMRDGDRDNSELVWDVCKRDDTLRRAYGDLETLYGLKLADAAAVGLILGMAIASNPLALIEAQAQHREWEQSEPERIQEDAEGGAS